MHFDCGIILPLIKHVFIFRLLLEEETIVSNCVCYLSRNEIYIHLQSLINTLALFIYIE